MEKFAAFEEPALEIFEAADFRDFATFRDEFEDAGAADEQVFFFEKDGEGFGSERGARGERAADSISRFFES